MNVPGRQLYIGGSWQTPAQGKTFDVYSPSSGNKIGTIPAATAEDVDKAITAALNTYKSGVWSKKSGAYRAKFLRAIAEQVYIYKLQALETCFATEVHQNSLCSFGLRHCYPNTRYVIHCRSKSANQT